MHSRCLAQYLWPKYVVFRPLDKDKEDSHPKGLDGACDKGKYDSRDKSQEWSDIWNYIRKSCYESYYNGKFNAHKEQEYCRCYSNHYGHQKPSPYELGQGSVDFPQEVKGLFLVLFGNHPSELVDEVFLVNQEVEGQYWSQDPAYYPCEQAYYAKDKPLHTVGYSCLNPSKVLGYYILYALEKLWHFNQGI